LKAKKQDRNLRELFRNKLENAEIIPDPSVSSKLMRQLTVREFLHFYPSQFNVYYLGGILAAAAVAIMVFSTRLSHKDKVQPQGIINQLPVKEKSENIIVLPDPIRENKKLEGKEKQTSDDLNISVPGNKAPGEKVNVTEKATQGNYDILPGRVSESLKGKKLFSQSSRDNLKLQEKTVEGEQFLESSVTEGCAPLKVVFKNKLAENDSCLWTFGDGGSSWNKNPEWIYDVEGEYRVLLKVYGPQGMISSNSSVISVFPKPTARFEITPDKAVIPEDEIRFQNYSASAVRYSWNFGDGNMSDQFEPFHRYEKYGNYNVSLKVYTEKGCSDSLVVLNAFSGSAYYIEFPNAFIPNTGGPSGGVYSSKSDESAQVFHPSFSGVSEYHLKIFSKMGVLIFDTNDINIGWDGYYKGQLSNPGVYIWKVRGNFSNGEPFTKMGDVTLLRN
jgi:PKD repeat protein